MDIRSLVLLLSLAATPAMAATTLYEQGVSAFRQGDYRQALELFLQQRESGDRRASLQYNIAVCYFSLGRYREAKEQFRQLQSDPKWQDLATYNLALTEENLGNRATAERWLTSVAEEAADTRLRQLAQLKLNNLEPAPARSVAAADAERYLLLSAAAGYDSNPYGLNDKLLSSDNQDSYTDLLADAGQNLNAGQQNPLFLEVTAFARTYQQLSDLDWRSISAGADYENQTSTRWQPGIGAFTSYSTFGGDPYTATASLRLSLRHIRDDQQYLIRYEPGITYGLDGNDNLDGVQNRLRLSWQMNRHPQFWRLEYRYDSQSQDQQTTDAAVSGLSRQQSQLRTDMLRHLSEHWAWRLNGRLSRTVYDDESTVTDLDGTVKTQQRITLTASVLGGIRYRPQDNWEINAGATLSHAWDTFDIYDHDRLEYSVSLTYLMM